MLISESESVIFVDKVLCLCVVYVFGWVYKELALQSYRVFCTFRINHAVLFCFLWYSPLGYVSIVSLPNQCSTYQQHIRSEPSAVVSQRRTVRRDNKVRRKRRPNLAGNCGLTEHLEGVKAVFVGIYRTFTFIYLFSLGSL